MFLTLPRFPDELHRAGILNSAQVRMIRAIRFFRMLPPDLPLMERYQQTADQFHLSADQVRRILRQVKSFKC